MFKYIVVYSVLAVMAMAQPITNGKEDVNRILNTAAAAAIEGADASGAALANIAGQAANAASTSFGQASSATSQFVSEATNTATNIGAQAAGTVSQFGSQAANAINTVGTESVSVGAQAAGAAAQFGSQAGSTITNIGAQAANAANHLGQQAMGAASQIGSQIQQQYQYQKATLGQVIDRLGDAAKLTVIEEKESIAKALKSIGTATGHTFQAGLDTLGTGFDMILIVPKFALNALGITKPTTITL